MVRRPLEADRSPADSSALHRTRAQSARSDSDTISPSQFTPSSTRSRSDSASLPGTLDFDPDVPIPSIEREPDEASSLSTHNSSSARARTPSFSITPPATEGMTTPIPPSGTSHGTSPTPSYTVLSPATRTGLELSERAAGSSSRSDSLPGAGRHHSQSFPTTSVAGQHSTRSPVDSVTVSHGIGNIRLGSPVDSVTHGMGNIRFDTEDTRPGTPTPRTYLHPRSPSPNISIDGAHRSIRSTSRRRSGSYVDPTPHNVAEEEPPRERFHEPEFQREFTTAKNLVNDLVNVLASSSLHNEAQSRIRALYLQAVDLSRFQKPSARIVALVGDGEVGKSSLLNSLLDFEGFARSGSSGKACTCVATEYHYHENDDFAIEIEYFTLDELRDQLTELLQSYRHYYLRPAQENDKPEGEQNDLEKRAEVAQDTFQAAFCNHLAHNERFLLDNSEATVLRTLLTWTRATGLPIRETPGAGPEREFFNEANQCSDRLIKLTSESTSPNEASIWPFIRKIKVYLNAYILSKGLILADLPGLRDVNSARLKITERYLLNCDEIFVVCRIGRAITDASVMGVIELARRASLSRIGIVCTRSEEIQADEAQRDFGGDAPTTIKRLKDKIKQMQESLKATEREISDFSIDSDTEAEIDEEESKELVRLHNAAKKILQTNDCENLRLKTFLMTTRNEKVTADLRTAHQSHIPGGNLPVFCVSNRDYWEHRRNPKEEAMPLLHLSGILQLRRYCLSVVAESQLQAALDYMFDAIPALLGSVELWVQSGAGSLSAERKQAIRDTIEEIEKALDTVSCLASPVNANARSMEQQFNTHIARSMRQYSNDWSEAAYNVTIEWHGWSHGKQSPFPFIFSGEHSPCDHVQTFKFLSGTYAAFCRKYGDHSTKATVRPRCWNQEAIQAMVDQLATPWRTFRQNLQASQDNLLNTIDDCFDCAIALSDSTDATARSMRTLTMTMRHRQALLIAAVENLEDGFQSDLSVLRTDAFSGIRSSFIGQLMESAYNRTIQESGTGSDSRRKKIIGDAFGDDQLFERHRRQFRSRFSALAGGLQDKIQAAIATHLAAVQTDLDTLRNENVALESERHPEFRNRVEDAVRNIRQEMEGVYAVASRFRAPTT
ncbi:uncharacterized protein Z520_01345 [Fonsecaea multimorphosa CBS 102226]|uniref:G domain-containing protein n=1 Tax=Fonsecaea multimorphosa CBS 102226 TaxID=1442371 RepID=A0A0D2KHF4_9EURO|nr:uncharacterized protein Z520_01345 [Fonsecaea multimorphosa CBS 102226]KIY02880.1 hypothetical protein Z520_01345 [Fonsecaea multimorphosa CBS 102226]